MKRCIVLLLTTGFFFTGASVAFAAEETYVSLSEVFPSLALDAAKIAGQSGEPSSYVLTFEEKEGEAKENTTDVLPTLPPVLVPMVNLTNKDLAAGETKSHTNVKVLPIAPSDTLGISTFFTRFHHGVDIRAKIGSPIMSMHAGKVITVAYEGGGYGRYVVIEHEEGTSKVTTLYAHMKETKVSEGEVVEATTVIGSVGMTGRTTGPHLHLEIYQNDVAIDPIRYFTKGLTTKTIASIRR